MEDLKDNRPQTTDNRLLASLDKEEVLNPEPRSPTEQEDFRPHGYEWIE